eukprot:7963806-Pyramimonas_sp.AAC.1
MCIRDSAGRVQLAAGGGHGHLRRARQRRSRWQERWDGHGQVRTHGRSWRQHPHQKGEEEECLGSKGGPSSAPPRHASAISLGLLGGP